MNKGRIMLGIVALALFVLALWLRAKLHKVGMLREEARQASEHLKRPG